MNKRTQDYRRIYYQHYGEVPKDEFGRVYDIHHKDGDHTNNSPHNLVAIPIQEHYNIHYANGDWGACVMIGLRMKLSPAEISNLNSMAAKKRVQDGTHHWTTAEHSTNLSKRNREAIANGTHHMLGGEIQRNVQNRRVKAGIHHLCGPSFNLTMIANGVHPSQKEFRCPHCGTVGKGATNAKRWHFDNCKKKNI